ncbi:hypothetical protein AVEN_122566-1 [Araneus ventricosus]|uniref:Uncharacterized protein n=1 Tax=Araneus ventricosus TaxID=182803 RepID=A0A4Y2RJ47_ARAVE|nr:hypothetical protein AVEN_122566-1 [Araneus ventricosus]
MSIIDGRECSCFDQSLDMTFDVDLVLMITASCGVLSTTWAPTWPLLRWSVLKTISMLLEVKCLRQFMYEIKCGVYVKVDKKQNKFKGYEDLVKCL